ncbi:PAS domain S-box protein [Pseudoalteromonas luteoviolacea]|uniref:PAS domain S-box protein n=1 Tax=Pseudoalteromonas luteoviolacea TaxID=43657 RepID=UPI001F2D86F2|nr:PAS domain S-box protein [Pseudoalteromonas luteoviolacea]MCF6441049.1 PAS domain S-box protein [Pseudoalteromonas luteoviolacea]
MSKNTHLNNLKVPSYQESYADFPSKLNGNDLLSALKASMEFAADEVFWIDANAEILYANNAAHLKLGYKQYELNGTKIWEWDTTFSKELWPLFWQELQTRKHIEFESLQQTKTGDSFPIQLKGHYFKSNNEEMFIVFISDLTDKKQEAEKLKAQAVHISNLLEQEKKRFSEFVDLAPVGVAINRLDDGAFDYINHEFSQFSGYSLDELNGMNYWQLTPKKYEVQEKIQLADIARTGRYGPYEKEYIHKNGYTFPVLLSGIKITEIDGTDYIWSVVQDISQQKQIEQQLAQAKHEADTYAHRMQLANDSAGIGVWEWDLNDDSLIWDAWMYKLYGIDEKQFSGAYEAWENSVHPDDIASAKSKLQAAIEHTGIYDPEFRVIHPSGEIRTLKASAEVICDNEGNPIRVIGVNYDITDKITALETLEKARKKAEEATKSKSDFLANMSHEIRTPMNAILGGLQLLQNEALDDNLKVLIDNAAYSAKSLLTIINDILDYSKIESNKLELEQAPLSFIEVIESVKYDLDPLVSNKGIEFISIIDDDFSDGWLGDIVRIKQILLNLTSNAVKFTDIGKVTLQVSIKTYKNMPAICVTVIDSGIGMSTEAQKRIFERFAQADSSTTRKYGGTGLGMSITLNLIKMMGGNIDVVSTPNVGTKVQVVLPLKQSSLGDVERKTKSISAPDLTGKKLLIAEDNKINQVVIASFLKDTNANLTIVENGKLAIQAVEEGEFDLILMDIHMPEMDGVEAQKHIHSIKNNIPIIALTANVMVEDVKSYLALGFDAHIGKPIDMSNLFGVLEAYSNT